MRRIVTASLFGMAALAPLAASAPLVAQAGGVSDLKTLPAIATVDRRFQSYNVEMVEVTGGRFWAPYGGPPGEVYRMRPPMDLRSRRLIQLARHLAPAYMRVSGTWANSTYVEAPGERVGKPPAGFQQVLTRNQWRDVAAFSRAVDAPIVTSFAGSAGTRGADGRWRPDQAQRFLDLNRQVGGRIAAAEFINEPNAAALGALPAGYTAQDYGRDFAIFQAWARKAAPGMTILGPGSVAEGLILDTPEVRSLGPGFIPTRDLMAQTAGRMDAVSYHFYGGPSQRCANVAPVTARKDEALTARWLDMTLREHGFYAGLRDRFEPGKPLWLTETAQAACGGSPWGATFLDTFRYVNQLGALAQKGVRVVAHNTLAASDYALLDEDTFAPRPSYWAAVLWQRTMGPTVLAPPRAEAGLRLYAQCLPARGGGVGLVAINAGEAARRLDLPAGARVWVLSSPQIESKDLLVNGKRPMVDRAGAIRMLDPVAGGRVLAMAPATIAFVAVPGAGNAACR